MSLIPYDITHSTWVILPMHSLGYCVSCTHSRCRYIVSTYIVMQLTILASSPPSRIPLPHNPTPVLWRIDHRRGPLDHRLSCNHYAIRGIMGVWHTYAIPHIIRSTHIIHITQRTQVLPRRNVPMLRWPRTPWPRTRTHGEKEPSCAHTCALTKW